MSSLVASSGEQLHGPWRLSLNRQAPLMALSAFLIFGLGSSSRRLCSFCHQLEGNNLLRGLRHFILPFSVIILNFWWSLLLLDLYLFCLTACWIWCVEVSLALEWYHSPSMPGRPEQVIQDWWESGTLDVYGLELSNWNWSDYRDWQKLLVHHQAPLGSDFQFPAHLLQPPLEKQSVAVAPLIQSGKTRD